MLKENKNNTTQSSQMVKKGEKKRKKMSVHSQFQCSVYFAILTALPQILLIFSISFCLTFQPQSVGFNDCHSVATAAVVAATAVAARALLLLSLFWFLINGFLFVSFFFSLSLSILLCHTLIVLSVCAHSFLLHLSD